MPPNLYPIIKSFPREQGRAPDVFDFGYLRGAGAPLDEHIGYVAVNNDLYPLNFGVAPAAPAAPVAAPAPIAGPAIGVGRYRLVDGHPGPVPVDSNAHTQTAHLPAGFATRNLPAPMTWNEATALNAQRARDEAQDNYIRHPVPDDFWNPVPVAPAAPVLNRYELLQDRLAREQIARDAVNRQALVDYAGVGRANAAAAEAAARDAIAAREAAEVRESAAYRNAEAARANFLRLAREYNGVSWRLPIGPL